MTMHSSDTEQTTKKKKKKAGKAETKLFNTNCLHSCPFLNTVCYRSIKQTFLILC